MRPCTRRSGKPTDEPVIPGRGRGPGLDLTASVGNRSSADACFFSALLSGRQSFGGLPSPSPIGRDKGTRQDRSWDADAAGDSVGGASRATDSGTCPRDQRHLEGGQESGRANRRADEGQSGI